MAAGPQIRPLSSKIRPHSSSGLVANVASSVSISSGMLSNRDLIEPKRASSSRSSRPSAAQNFGHQCGSGMLRMIQRSSPQQKRLASAEMRWRRSRRLGWRPSTSAGATSVAIVQAAMPNRLASTDLPFARALDEPERSQDARHEGDARGVVALGRPGRRRDATGLDHGVSDAATPEERGDVVARPLGIRPDQSIAREGGVDEPGLQGEQRRHVQAEAELAPGQEVGEEHVAPLHEPADEVGALGTVDGDGDRALAAVVDEEGGVERRGTFRELGLAASSPAPGRRSAAPPSRRRRRGRPGRRPRSARPSNW